MRPAELQRHLAAYIALRDALGFAMHAERTLLDDFLRYAVARGATEALRARTAVEWATSKQSSKWNSGSAAKRLSMARLFLTYLRASAPETEVPAYGLLRGHRRVKPYLFTEEQIGTLRRAALQARPRGSLRPETLATLIGLLASTGLRIGEALRLSVDDVRIKHQPPHLLVAQTKFNKTRLVPFHHTTATELQRYLKRRSERGYDAFCDNLLVSEQGQPLNHDALGNWFGRLCRKHRMWPSDEHRPPSLTSLRHSFAVERMRTWYRDGADVHTLLPTLSVYLGHVSPHETYWYLTATPELLTQASSMFNPYAGQEDTP